MTQHWYTYAARALIITGACILLYALAYPHARIVPEPTNTNGRTHASIEGVSLELELAITGEAQERGLSGRDQLPDGQGMLFVFSQEGRYAFWMPDMHFSIDIVWLDSAAKVVYIAERVSPDSYPRSYVSDVPARYVLEVPAGWMKAHSLGIGAQLHAEGDILVK